MTHQQFRVRSISAFFPAYNEEGNIQHIIEVGVTHLPRVAGATCFEIGKGRLLNLPKPGVILDILREMIRLRREISPAARRFKEDRRRRP
ncbi:MAG: hypothetical protein P9M00_12205 [Candidatus Tritonobacter lacicola]|nr:hypothetical protein [Candidatus Tritonobacter lacicola]